MRGRVPRKQGNSGSDEGRAQKEDTERESSTGYIIKEGQGNSETKPVNAAVRERKGWDGPLI